MKKKIIIAAFMIAATACGSKQDGAKQEEKKEATKIDLLLKGSDTVLPLAQKEAEEFLKLHPEAALTVTGGGSGVGITAMMEGSLDICMSSRPLKTDEKIKLDEKKIEVKEKVVAFDALAVIVNNGNKVSQLTHEQLADIFTGKISNWKDVGGANEKIVVYARESSSGTYEFFREHVMDKKNYATSVLSMPATGAIVQSVSQTKGAIGYVGIAYETKEVKPIAVSYDEGKTFVLPSIASAKDKTYPIARPLYFFYDSRKEDKVKSFVDFVMSSDGQKHIAEVGYVTVN